MNKEVIELLNKAMQGKYKEDREFSIDEIKDFLTIQNIVSEKLFDTRRWYQIWTFVVKIKGKFIAFEQVVAVSDMYLDDDDELMPLNTARFVTPKTIEVTVYE